MKIQNEKYLKTIKGGALNLTGSLISAFTGLVKVIYSVGQDLGGAIRRISSGKVCKI